MVEQKINRDEALKFKAQGNEEFKAKNWDKAIEHFSKA